MSYFFRIGHSVLPPPLPLALGAPTLGGTEAIFQYCGLSCECLFMGIILFAGLYLFILILWIFFIHFLFEIYCFQVLKSTPNSWVHIARAIHIVVDTFPVEHPHEK